MFKFKLFLNFWWSQYHRKKAQNLELSNKTLDILDKTSGQNLPACDWVRAGDIVRKILYSKRERDTDSEITTAERAHLKSQEERILYTEKPADCSIHGLSTERCRSMIWRENLVAWGKRLAGLCSRPSTQPCKLQVPLWVWWDNLGDGWAMERKPILSLYYKV